MSDHAAFDGGASQRAYKAPYSSRRPVPNIQDYGETLQSREKDATQEHHKVDPDHHTNALSTAISAAKRHIVHRHTEADDQSNGQQPYPCENRNHESTNQGGNEHEIPPPALTREGSPLLRDENDSTNATYNNLGDMPNQTRKPTQPPEGDQQGREVTDPITHLPIFIHDSTSAELEAVPEHETSEGPAPHSEKNDRPMQGREQQVAHDEMEALFPPPSLEATGQRLASILKTAITAGFSFLLVCTSVLLGGSHLYYARGQTEQGNKQTTDLRRSLLVSIVLLLIQAIVSSLLVLGTRAWVEKKALSMWNDKIWDTHDKRKSASSVPESVQWLNSLLMSIWPLVNPDVRQFSELFYPPNAWY